MIADAAPDRRPLGEDQKILTLVEHLHRGLDGLDILAVALDGKCAERADEPRERAVVEKLGLGHKVQMVVERQAQADEHGVKVCRMVRAQQDTVLRKIFKSLDVHAVDPQKHPTDDPDKRKEDTVHHFNFS